MRKWRVARFGLWERALANYYLQNNRKTDISKVIESYKQNLSFGHNPELDNKFIEGLENMKNQ